MLFRERTKLIGERDDPLLQEQPALTGHVTLQLELKICSKKHKKVRRYSAFTKLSSQKAFILQRKG